MGKAQEWRERARTAALASAVELELPSGMVVKARRPGLDQLLAWDALPSRLAASVGEKEEASAAPASTDEVLQMAGFLRELLAWCVLEPRITLAPAGEDEIHPRDIPNADTTFILNWAMRTEEVRPLERFRERGKDAGSDGGGEGVGAEAVDDRRHHGAGSGLGI